MMKILKIVKSVVLVLSSLMCVTAFADDIDLYVNHKVNKDENPRVLIIFDTSGSMAFSTSTGGRCYDKNRRLVLCSDSRLEVAQEAVRKLLDANDDIDFGLMRFRGLDGGYVLSGLGTSIETIKQQVSDLPANGGTPLVETLWEAYLYITGQNLRYGTNAKSNERDTSVEVVSGFNPNKTYTYLSPFHNSSEEKKRCDNSVNIILMTDGDPSFGYDKDQDDTVINLHEKYFGRKLERADKIAGSYLHGLARVIHGAEASKENDTDEVIIDLYPSTKDIHETGRVYTIGFGSGMSSQGKALLDKTAEWGGGKYFHANSSEELSSKLNSALSNIREVNDTFTSPSTASNNADQTRSRESIYYTMFYPDKGARWRGNLKKLKVIGGTIVDSQGKPALSPDGQIKSEAKTFWLSPDEYADGNLVKEGGVNAFLSTQNSIAYAPGRRLILSNLKGDELVHFTGTNIMRFYGTLSKAREAFGDKSASEHDIHFYSYWSRGIDGLDADGDGVRWETRQDVFGDPLHSKPVTIDYGNDDVRILIGTNAGYLHMFQDKNDVLSESWAFIPRSLYKIIKPLKDNQEGTKVYGVDGPISIFFDDNNSDGKVNGSDRVWAFFGLRRGGNEYYGLDITDPNLPKLMWGGPIVGGSGHFKELGQSWSKPTVTYINLEGYKDRPVLIFGAGYDTNKDKNGRSNDSKGRGIYIVDAQTGKKIWALTPNENGFKGEHSIVSDIAILDSDYDGYIDRLYATDTGGDVWRVDMPSENPKNPENPWTYHKLASLGGASKAQDRRFFYKPLLARTMFSKVSETTINGKKTFTRIDTPFDAVLIGSGNRAKPLATDTNDQLFMIRDINTVTQSFTGNNIPKVITQSELMNINSDPFGNALNDVSKFTELEAELSAFQGWYYDLTAAGEKSLAASTVIGGVAYFTTYTPNKSSGIDRCSLTKGSGSMYAFHLHYGTKVYDNLEFTTSNDVPDTPQLFLGAGDSCFDQDNDGFCDDDETEEVKEQSQFLIIGPGLQNGKNPLRPVEINGPGLTVEDGVIKLISDDKPLGLGFKTQQTYIYKKEVNDQSH